MFQQRRILVIGSSGFLGRVIAKTLTSKYFVVFTHNQNPFFPESIQFTFPHDNLRSLVEEFKVDTCIFTAEIEKNQENHELDDLAFFRQAVNDLFQSLTTVRIVYISSDGIFDGQEGLYDESDIPQPTTEYGWKLKICEDTICSHCSNYCIVRPSYLYGHSLGILDNRLNRTKIDSYSQQEIAYFHDMFKSPLHVIDAANLIITLTRSKYIGVVHIGGPRMNVYDFHQEAMTALGVSSKISPIKMPADIGFLRDTSLNVALCTELTGFIPKSVTNSFFQYLEK